MIENYRNTKAGMIDYAGGERVEQDGNKEESIK
jgi:hypothetical protein